MIKFINIENIPADGRKQYRRRIMDIEEFISSGANACEVVPQGDETIKTLWSSYYNAINAREHFKKVVRPVQRQSRLFLIRIEGMRT